MLPLAISCPPLFKNFDIIHFKEIEEDRKTALGVEKHWHIYDVIAKKKL